MNIFKIYCLGQVWVHVTSDASTIDEFTGRLFADGHEFCTQTDANGVPCVLRCASIVMVSGPHPLKASVKK